MGPTSLTTLENEFGPRGNYFSSKLQLSQFPDFCLSCHQICLTFVYKNLSVRKVNFFPFE